MALVHLLYPLQGVGVAFGLIGVAAYAGLVVRI
jgi:hypothetical protein